MDEPTLRRIVREEIESAIKRESHEKSANRWGWLLLMVFGFMAYGGIRAFMDDEHHPVLGELAALLCIVIGIFGVLGLAYGHFRSRP